MLNTDPYLDIRCIKYRYIFVDLNAIVDSFAQYLDYFYIPIVIYKSMQTDILVQTSHPKTVV